jgi:predicted O-methyltransferase YrrM
MKALTVKALEALRLLDPARSLYGQFKANGLTPWSPLVPEGAFLECALSSIALLRERGHNFGDYLEFGVSRGTSMALMAKALSDFQLSAVRLIGFDSFEGMAKDAYLEGWRPGDFRSTQRATLAYLSSHGVAEHRLRLVKGWFNETLTEETRGSLGLQKASLIMIDCDAHTPSRLALTFACRSLVDEAVIFFDDWGWTEADKIAGQKEAFASYLGENPHLRAIELPSYRPEAKVFHVINTSI